MSPDWTPMSRREPTAYVLNEAGQRIGTITHEVGLTSEPGLLRQRWDGSWVKAQIWPEDVPESGRHRNRARHRRVK